MKERDLHWLGSSFEDLKNFPADAMSDAGFQLRKVQKDKEPDDWKPVATVGVGIREIRITAERGEYRVFYAIKLPGLVHILHCFHKTSEQTAQRDIKKGRLAYRQLELAKQAARKISKSTKDRRKKE